MATPYGSIVEIARRAGREATKEGLEWLIRCPNPDGHTNGDAHPSCHLNEAKGVYHCHVCGVQGGIRALATTLGVEVEGMSRKPVAVYSYRDEQGRVVYEVVRYEPKTFRQRSPDGTGGWRWGRAGVDPVLYRLPEVLAAVARGSLIFVVEGEKDADRVASLGFEATTNVGGAGKWKTAYAKAFTGGHPTVAVIADNDAPGRAHARQVAATLRGRAVHVVVLELPGLPAKGDVSNWLDAGGTVEELVRLAEEGASATPPMDAPATTEELQLSCWPLTDSGNAERLVAEHGQDFRYQTTLGWYAWDGARWAQDEAERLLLAAKEVARGMGTEAQKLEEGDPRRTVLLRHALRSESARGREAMVRLARCEPGIPVRVEQLDADPWVLNVANGTLDLRTGQMREHRREDVLTKLAPVRHDERAKAPTWERFLAEVLPEEGDRRFLQRFIGYSLTGTIQEHVLVIFWGGGRNGKGTFIETIKAMLGPYAATIPTEMLLEQFGRNDPHPTEKMCLLGARLVWGSEPKAHRRLDPATVKLLTGGDTIRARYMHRDFVEFGPTHKLCLLTNHRLAIDETSLAMWERVRLIPWTQQFTVESGRQDRDLPQKLRAELPGILNWALAGCMQWQQYTLGSSEAIEDATRSYRRSQDVIGQFLEDRCCMSEYARYEATGLYQGYRSWAEEQGDRPMTQRTFGEGLSERGFEHRRKTGGRWEWVGVGLRQEESGD